MIGRKRDVVGDNACRTAGSYSYGAGAFLRIPV